LNVQAIDIATALLRLGTDFVVDAYVFEGARAFKGAKELELGVIVDGADLQLDQDLPLVVTRLDTDKAHAGGKNFFQVHKHLSPIQAFLVNQRIEESGALIQSGVTILLEEGLKLITLADEADHFLTDGRSPGAERFIGLAGGVHVPAKREAYKPGSHTNEGGQREKLAVRLQGICGDI
jgi:hypothetical protein